MRYVVLAFRSHTSTNDSLTQESCRSYISCVGASDSLEEAQKLKDQYRGWGKALILDGNREEPLFSSSRSIA